MKNIYTLAATVLLSTIGFAQFKPSFGVKAGLATFSIKGDANNSLQSILDFTDGMVTTNSRTGFFAGGYATLPVGDGFSFEPGVFYTQKGYVLNGNLDIKGVEFLGVNAGAKLQADYLDIPLLLKAELGGLQVFAGPQFSYLMKSNLKTTAGALGINILNRSFDVSDQFNKWDMGVTAGAGYQFGNGMNISASYDHGLSKIDANKNVAAYNRGFKLGVGFRF